MIRTIGKHLDALYVTVEGDISEALDRILAAHQEQAQELDRQKTEALKKQRIERKQKFSFTNKLSDKSDLDYRSYIAGHELVPGGEFWVEPKGGKGYKYVLRNDRIFIKVSNQGHLPALSIQFLAECLYEYDLDALQEIVSVLCSMFCPDYKRKLVSRVDVAVDFQGTEEDFEIPDHKEIVSRATNRLLVLNRLSVQTLTIGRHHGALQATIYNKTAELLKSKKFWLRQVWEEAPGYDPARDVFRAEIRYFREGLSSMQVDSFDDLRSNLGDLLDYAVNPDRTGSWLRFADQQTRGKRAARRSAATWWSDVAHRFVHGELVTGRRRLRPKALHSFAHAREMSCAWVSKMVALARRSKLHDGHTDIWAWVGETLLHHLRDKEMTWAEAVNKQTAKIPEALEPVAGVVFDLSPAGIGADSLRVASLRKQDREHRRLMEQDRSSPAWAEAVASLEEKIRKNEEIARELRAKNRRQTPEPPEISSSTAKLLEVRPSIKHEAGFYVSR